MQWLSKFNAKAMNFNDVATDSVKGSDYKIHFWYMSKDNAISIMNSSDLSEKSGLLTFFYLHIINE